MKVDAIPCKAHSGCECRKYQRNTFHPIVKTRKHRLVWPISYPTRAEAVERGQALVRTALSAGTR